MTFSQRRNVVTFSNFVNGVYDVFTEYFIANVYRKMFYQIASYTFTIIDDLFTKIIPEGLSVKVKRL